MVWPCGLECFPQEVVEVLRSHSIIISLPLSSACLGNLRRYSQSIVSSEITIVLFVFLRISMPYREKMCFKNSSVRRNSISHNRFFILVLLAWLHSSLGVAISKFILALLGWWENQVKRFWLISAIFTYKFQFFPYFENSFIERGMQNIVWLTRESVINFRIFVRLTRRSVCGWVRINSIYYRQNTYYNISS